MLLQRVLRNNADRFTRTTSYAPFCVGVEGDFVLEQDNPDSCRVAPNHSYLREFFVRDTYTLEAEYIRKIFRVLLCSTQS